MFQLLSSFPDLASWYVEVVSRAVFLRKGKTASGVIDAVSGRKTAVRCMQGFS
jgi:hypothetical protein